MFFQIGLLGREIFQIKYRIYTIKIMYINIWVYIYIRGLEIYRRQVSALTTALVLRS